MSNCVTERRYARLVFFMEELSDMTDGELRGIFSGTIPIYGESNVLTGRIDIALAHPCLPCLIPGYEVPIHLKDEFIELKKKWPEQVENFSAHEIERAAIALGRHESPLGVVEDRIIAKLASLAGISLDGNELTIDWKGFPESTD